MRRLRRIARPMMRRRPASIPTAGRAAASASRPARTSPLELTTHDHIALRIDAVNPKNRLQIVREHTDPIAYAYLKGLGRRCEVEVAVNTSYNVAAPIAQSPVHAIESLHRANGMDGVFIFSSEGPVVAAWARYPKAGAGGKIEAWLADWRLDTGIANPSTVSISYAFLPGWRCVKPAKWPKATPCRLGQPQGGIEARIVAHRLRRELLQIARSESKNVINYLVCGRAQRIAGYELYAKAPTCDNTDFTVVRVCSSNSARATSSSLVDRRPLASGGISAASLPKRSARPSSRSTTVRRVATSKVAPFSNPSMSSRDGR